MEGCFTELVKAIDKNHITVYYGRGKETKVDNIKEPTKEIIKGLIKELSTYLYIGKGELMTFRIKCYYTFWDKENGIEITVTIK